MDRIALISDIHGNMPALDATLADIQRRGIRRIFCLGDLVGKGPHSEAVVDCCQRICEKVIRGNWDDSMANLATGNFATEWHRARLGAERLHYLRTLPNTIELQMSGRRIRLFHASQQSIYHRVFRDDTLATHLAMFSNTDFTGYRPEPTVVGYGDIHDAYLIHPGLKTLFNVGSVGNPLDIPQAAYVILEGIVDGTALDPFAIQFVRVAYDIELAIQQAKAEAMPFFDEYAHELRTAEYVRRRSSR
jgi:protein phosphatase